MKSKQQPVAMSSGNAEVNLVLLSMRGDVGAIGKDIESLVQSFRGQNAYVLAPAATPRPPAALPATNAASAAEDEAGSPDPQLTLDDIQTPAPAAAMTPRPPKNRTPPKPAKFIDEVKAHEEPGGFKSFVGQRSFLTDNKKGLAAARWLTDHGYAQFNIDHVNSCFSLVKWSLPDDPGQLLRNMAKAKSGLVRHVDKKPGFYELTGKGVSQYAEIV